MEKLLTAKQVSGLLQVSNSLIYKWVHYGYMPHIKIGSLLRFKESQIFRWVNAKEKKGRKNIDRFIVLDEGRLR